MTKEKEARIVGHMYYADERILTEIEELNAIKEWQDMACQIR